MTPDQIRLVRHSFAKITDAPSVAHVFYTCLFDADPAIRPLFPADLAAQGIKLMAMLTTVVNGLDRIELLVSAIEGLGRRHVGYGVVDRHYPIVGGALVATLEQALGDAFTGEVRAAWIEAYSTLSTVMMNAARMVAADPVPVASGRRARSADAVPQIAC